MRGLDSALGRIATVGRLLVGVDFDGTLSEIVPRPEDAGPVEGAIDLLVGLARLPRTWVALVSGRTRQDLRLRSGAPEEVLLIGSHGVEPGPGAVEHPELPAVASAVEQVAASHRGARVERKPASVTVHTRGMEDREAAALVAEVRDVAAANGHRVEEGKRVVEIHLSDLTKGTALRELQESVGADAVVYVGDDTTDEEAFAVLGGADLGIKVGEGPTRAAFRVDTPAEVAHLLERLHALRRAWLEEEGLKDGGGSLPA